MRHGPAPSRSRLFFCALLAALALGSSAGCGGGAEAGGPRVVVADPAGGGSGGGEAASGVTFVPAGEIVVPAAARAAVDAPERSAEDRALDAGRRPAEFLAFVGVAPGMRVGELGVGRGYTTELLARVVGEAGEVHAQNSQFLLERFAEEPWSARLEKPVMAPVRRHDRAFEAPFADDVRDLDVVINVLFYHDTYWQEVDRAAMNRAVFEALRPGGRYVIVDHSAAPGAGATQVKTLHRVEESLVRDEIEAAGFVLSAETDLLRNPDDARDWSASPGAAEARRGTSDRFTLVFVKPGG